MMDAQIAKHRQATQSLWSDHGDLPLTASQYGVSFIKIGNKISTALDDSVTRSIDQRHNNVFAISHIPSSGSASPTVDITPYATRVAGVRTYVFDDDISSLAICPAMEEISRLINAGFPGMVTKAILIHVCDTGATFNWEKYTTYNNDDISMIVTLEISQASEHCSLQIYGFPECHFRSSGNAMFFPSGCVHQIKMNPNTTLVQFYLSGKRTHVFSKKLQTIFCEAVAGELPSNILNELTVPNKSPEIESLLEAPSYREMTSSVSFSDILIANSNRAETPLEQKETRAISAMSNLYNDNQATASLSVTIPSSESTMVRSSVHSTKPHSDKTPHQLGKPFCPASMVVEHSNRARKSRKTYYEHEAEDDENGDDEVSMIMPSPLPVSTIGSSIISPSSDVFNKCTRHENCVRENKHRGSCKIIHPRITITNTSTDVTSPPVITDVLSDPAGTTSLPIITSDVLKCSRHKYCIRTDGHSGMCNVVHPRTATTNTEITSTISSVVNDSNSEVWARCSRNEHCIKEDKHRGCCKIVYPRKEMTTTDCIVPAVSTHTDVFDKCTRGQYCTKCDRHVGKCNDSRKDMKRKSAYIDEIDPEEEDLFAHAPRTGGIDTGREGLMDGNIKVILSEYISKKKRRSENIDCSNETVYSKSAKRGCYKILIVDNNQYEYISEEDEEQGVVIMS